MRLTGLSHAVPLSERAPLIKAMGLAPGSTLESKLGLEKLRRIRIPTERYHLPADTFSRLYHDMAATLSRLIAQRYSSKTFQRKVKSRNGFFYKYKSFENAPSVNFSVDAKGSEKVLSLPTEAGDISIKMYSTKWLFLDQHRMVDSFHNERFPTYQAVESFDEENADSLSDLRQQLELYLIKQRPFVRIKGKIDSTSYSGVGRIETDGSAQFDVRLRAVFTFMFLLENQGDVWLKKLGKLCETCLWCGSQLMDRESILRRTGPDWAKTYGTAHMFYCTTNITHIAMLMSFISCSGLPRGDYGIRESGHLCKYCDTEQPRWMPRRSTWFHTPALNDYAWVLRIDQVQYYFENDSSFCSNEIPLTSKASNIFAIPKVRQKIPRSQGGFDPPLNHTSPTNPWMLTTLEVVSKWWSLILMNEYREYHELQWASHNIDGRLGLVRFEIWAE